MIKLTKKVDCHASFDVTLSLPIDTRIRSRARVTLDDGREAGLFLTRGSLLRNGDKVSDEYGLVVKILAAKESVSTAYCESSLLLAKAAYHLGNRHIPLQIERTWLRYQQDKVLDDMLRQMGLETKQEQAEFEPEAGAYKQHVHNVNVL